MPQGQQGKLPFEHSLLVIDITDEEFDRFSQLIYSLTGINITEKKRQLVISRLAKRLKLHGLRSFSEYYDLVHDSRGGATEVLELINQITTNKTDFFRESHHFDFIADTLLPALVSSGSKNFRFWSAGCSTGEEPYTMLITIMETLERLGASRGADIKVLATDLDTQVLRATSRGIYAETKLAPVPRTVRAKYFTELEPGYFQVVPALRRLLTVGRLNLMDAYPFKKGFNGVFCRNVLIYFTAEDRQKVVKKMHDHIRPGGYLFLGHSESLLADSLGYRNLGNTIYQRVT